MGKRAWLRRIFLLLGVCAGPVMTAAGVPELTARRVSGAIRIDGKLDEAAWAAAPVCDRFVTGRDRTAAKVRTEVRFLYDNNAVIVGIKAFMPQGARYEINNRNLYAGECVEVMLDPGETRTQYFHFLTNPDAAKVEEFRDQGGFVGDLKWEAVWDCASFKGDGFWSCEMRIPYSGLDFPDGDSLTWGVNVTRGACGLPPGSGRENSAITPDGSYHVAGKFPLLKGFDRSFGLYAGWFMTRPQIAAAQQKGEIALSAAVTVTNSANRVRDAVASVDFIAPDGTTQRRVQRAKFAPGKGETLRFGNFLFAEPGDFQAVCSLSDASTRRVLKRKMYRIPVRFQPLTIHLRDPHYKQAIFASMKLDKVRYDLAVALPEAELADKTVLSGIRTLDGKVLTSQRRKAAVKSSFEFPVAPLPEAKMRIFATLLDKAGQPVGDASLALRKLPYLPGEVYLDKDQTFRRDGKRIFPIQQWGAREDFLEDIDVFLDWKPYRGKLLNSPIFSHDKRMKKIMHGTAVTAEDEAYIRAKVAEQRREPMLFSYLLADEPEVFGCTVEGTRRVYEIASDEDPYHPFKISNDTVGGIADYADCGDVNGVHAFLKVSRDKPFEKYGNVVRYCDGFHSVFKDRYHKQALLWGTLCFDYSNYGQFNTRVPRYLEMRNEYLTAIALGARSANFYSILRDHYPELQIGTQAVVSEIKSYAPALAEPELENGLQCANRDLRWTVREHQGELLLIVANISPKEQRDVVFTVPKLAGRTLRVMTEERTVKPSGNVVRDSFAPWDVHVYRTGEVAPLPGRASIEAQIEAANARRRKPGNLAFQMFEGDTVQVTASSSQSFNVRPDNGLWHIADGVIEGPDFKRPWYGRLVVWADATPNVGPDWIAMRFRKPVKVGRVAVYAVENSLLDYQVQLLRGGQWVTVKTVKDASGHEQSHTFPAEETDGVRIFITAARGPHARIAEVEVYEK